jgi:hypothetical protein
MRKADEGPDKSDEILRQMREDSGSRKHLDQRKLRAMVAMRRAVEN